MRSRCPQAGSIGTSYYVAPVENIDARNTRAASTPPGFDDASWSAATAKTAIQGLTGTPAANVEQRLREPVTVVKTADKRYFVDFGRTVVGGVQLKLDGAGGEAVEIRLGEELDRARTSSTTRCAPATPTATCGRCGPAPRR